MEHDGVGSSPGPPMKQLCNTQQLNLSVSSSNKTGKIVVPTLLGDRYEDQVLFNPKPHSPEPGTWQGPSRY